MRIIQRLTCILHHLHAAIAQVLHCHANTIGSLGTEQCIIQRSTCILHHLYTALAQDLHCHADTTGNLGTKQYAHYTEVDLYQHHLYTALAQVLHCHADMTSNLGTEPCVHYTEADLHPAQPLYWQFGDLNVCTFEAGLETGQVCVCVGGGGGGVHACQIPLLCLLSDKVRVLVLTSELLVAAEAPQEALASWL